MLRVARSVPADDVDDVVQDVTADVVAAFDGLRPPRCASFCGFMATVTRRRIADYYRRRRPECPLEAIVDTEDDRLAAEMEAVEVGEDIQHLLIRTPARQAIALVLHAGFELSFADVAKVLGGSDDAAEQLYRRAIFRTAAASAR